MSPQLKAVLKDLLFLYHNHFCICNTSYLAHNIWKTSTYQAMYTWTWTGIFGLELGQEYLDLDRYIWTKKQNVISHSSGRHKAFQHISSSFFEFLGIN